MFLARKKENEAACRGDAQRAHPSPSSGPPDLSLSKAVSAIESLSSSRPALSMASVTSKHDISSPFTKADSIVPFRGTAST